MTGSRRWTFWYAVATLVGSTVGIGFFGIPFTFAKAGFGVGVLFLVVLGAAIIISDLLYGEVVLRTHQRHQFVGYVRRYLGPWARAVNLFSFWIGVYGSLIGIIVINGVFLSGILSYLGVETSALVASTIFIVFASCVVFLGLKTVSHVDFAMMFLVAIGIGIIGWIGVSHINTGNYTLFHSEFWFLPFGVILFALNNIHGIPLVREVITGSERNLKTALITGTLIPLGLYLLFAIVVVGVSGELTEPEGIPGLVDFLGPGVVMIGSLLGLLTSSTIFISIATSFQETMKEDFHFSRRASFLLSIVPPYILFLFGVRSFIAIIGLVGGIVVGLDAFLLILMYSRAKRHGDRIPEYSLQMPRIVLYILIGLFLFGAFYTMFHR